LNLKYACLAILLFLVLLSNPVIAGNPQDKHKTVTNSGVVGNLQDKNEEVPILSKEHTLNTDFFNALAPNYDVVYEKKKIVEHNRNTGQTVDKDEESIKITPKQKVGAWWN
jgi:hypothetical protein